MAKFVKINSLVVKKPRLLWLGSPAFLLAGCDPDDFHYCPGEFCYIAPEPDPIILPVISFEPTGPSAFVQTSLNNYSASDNSDHELNLPETPASLVVSSRGGDDIIETGSGNDNISASGGFDIVRSNGGNDTVSGGADFDHITAGSGDDQVNGDGGDDWLFGQDGNDAVYGGLGDDRIWGGEGIDELFGGDGNDTFEILEEENSYFEDGFNGGVGSDTLKFYVADTAFQMEIDLSLIDAINIEILDLNDLENEIDLELTLLDVVNITDADNELIIKGDSRDNVTSDGQGWVQEADQGGYHVYTSGIATLLIDTDIPQSIS